MDSWRALVEASAGWNDRPLSARRLPPPALDAERAAESACRLLGGAGVVPPPDRSLVLEALQGFLDGDPSPFERLSEGRVLRPSAATEAATPDTLRDVGATALFCVLLAVRQQWVEPRDSECAPPAGTPLDRCPVCGSIGRLEVLCGEDGRRLLACPACEARWRIPRIGCPRCGEADGRRLVVLTLPGLGGEAIVHCRSCDRAWRRRDTGRQPYPQERILEDSFLPWDVEGAFADRERTAVALRHRKSPKSEGGT